jgi:endogenous inhibitor of DNA gyrase (YacG/DUF329 family)
MSDSARTGRDAVPKCPICGRPARVDDRPFCSPRCADVDLHRWLNGRYAIPIENEDHADDVDDSGSPS